MPFDIEEKPTINTIAEIHKDTNKNSKIKYINCNPDGSLTEAEVSGIDYAIIPHIPNVGERFVCLVVGASGEGKTLIVSEFANQYIRTTKRKIYYVCPTDIKKDISLKEIEKNITQIFPTEINLDEESHSVEDFERSLVIFDDIDGCKNSKQAYKLLNELLVTGRKFNVSLIFISHENTHAKFSTFDKEINLYITNPYNLENNRFLQLYLQRDIKHILNMVDKNDAFFCINKTFNYAMSDTFVCSIAQNNNNNNIEFF